MAEGACSGWLGFLNKTCKPALEYVDAKTAAAPFTLDTAAKNDSQWTLKTASARQVSSGGRPAVQLDVTLTRGDILAQFHVLAFPGTPILRQWVEIENKGAGPIEFEVADGRSSSIARRRGRVLPQLLDGRRARGKRSGENVPTAGHLAVHPQAGWHGQR